MKLSTQFISTTILLASTITGQAANIPEECQRLGFCTGQDSPDSCNKCQLDIAVKNAQFNKEKNFQPGNPNRLPETFNPAVPFTGGNGNGNGNPTSSQGQNNGGQNPPPSPTSINGGGQNPPPPNNGGDGQQSSADGNNSDGNHTDQNQDATSTINNPEATPTSDTSSSRRSTSSLYVTSQTLPNNANSQYQLYKLAIGVVSIAIAYLI